MIPGILKDDYIIKNCRMAREDKFIDMDPVSRLIFTNVKEVDDSLGKVLNENMCTTHCKCYSKLGQKPKSLYDGYSPATLKQYGRDTKPLVWSN